LTASWDVVERQPIASRIGPTRTEEDFLWHIDQTVRVDPEANWIFALDQLNIHCSESLVRYVARGKAFLRTRWGRKVGGDIEVGGEPPGVLGGPEPSHPFCLLAETQFLDESGGDRVRHRVSTVPQPARLHVGGGFKREALAVY